jgi:mitogen-activated protein kinase organizer 1
MYPSNDRFLSCGGDKAFFLWETIEGKWVRKFEGHSQQINSICVNETATVCASASLDGTVAIWDLLSRS